MYSSQPKLPDGIYLERKIKVLEINSQQFYSQLKPLFTENTQLKQHIISLNFFMEERKLQLCKVISDTGPDGEDRTLIKAVSDLKQICDLVEEELNRLNNVIENHQNKEDQQSNEIQELKQYVQQEKERFFQEKQQLIDQQRRQSEYYRNMQQTLNEKINQQKMKSEDYQSQIMELQEYAKELNSKYQLKMEQNLQGLKEQINQQKIEQNYLIESFDQERRAYLKQLEVTNARMKEIKEETIDEYEYKLASQRMKLENSITTLKQENQNNRHTITTHLDTIRNYQQQIDKLNQYITHLETDIQQFKYAAFQQEEAFKAKDQKLKSLQGIIEDQKELLNKTKIDLNKKMMEITRLEKGRPSYKGKLDSQQSDKKWKQSGTFVRRDPMSKSTNSKKQSDPMSEQDTKQETKIQQEGKSDNKQEMPQLKLQVQTSDQESRSESQIYDSPNSFLKSPSKQCMNQLELNEYPQKEYADVQTQTEQEQQLQRVEENISQEQLLSNKSLFSQSSLKLENRISQLDKEIQCTIEFSYGSNVQYMVDDLTAEIQKLKQNNQCQLKRKDTILLEMQNEIEEKDKLHQSQLKKLESDLECLHQEEMERKDNELKKVSRQLDDAKEYANGLEINVKQYEELQEEIHDLYDAKLSEKDIIIKQLKEQQNQMKEEFHREQNRQIQIAQQIRQEYQQEVEGLLNQHHLDQEQIKQEQHKYENERQDNQQFKKETQQLITQVKAKEELLDSYRNELMRATEIVRYLQLELENYKKINNMFKPKQNDQMNVVFSGLGFLPLEIQDRIRSKMNRLKHKEMQMRQSQIDRDAYALNFSQQRSIKMKPARVGQVLQNLSVESKHSESQLHIRQLMKTETDLDSGLPKLSSKRIKLEMGSDIKNKKNRSKTQTSENDQQELVREINKREEQLIKSSQQLLFQLNGNGLNKIISKQKTHLKE